GVILRNSACCRFMTPGKLRFSGCAHTRRSPCCGSSFVRCFLVMYFLRNMRRRGIEMIWTDFELCQYCGGKQQRNESIRCHTSNIFEHSINPLLISGNSWWLDKSVLKN